MEDQNKDPRLARNQDVAKPWQEVAQKKLEIKTLIGENEHYELHIVRLPDMDLDSYGVLHKKWGVLEMSTSVLANARKFLSMLDEWERNPSSASSVEDMLPDMPIGPTN